MRARERVCPSVRASLGFSALDTDQAPPFPQPFFCLLVLAGRLADVGFDVGVRMLELLVHREKGGKRENRI